MKCMLLVLVLILFAGCGAGTDFIRKDPTYYPPKNKSYRMTVLTEQPDRSYKPIGIVVAKKQAINLTDTISESEVRSALEDEGKKIGADALMDLQFEPYTVPVFGSSTLFKHGLRGRATAIIYIQTAGAMPSQVASRPPVDINRDAFGRYEDEKKDKAIALLLFALLPGGGQFYTNNTGPGVAYLGLSSLGAILYANASGDDHDFKTAVGLGIVTLRVIELIETLSAVDDYNRSLRLRLGLSYRQGMPGIAVSLTFP